LARYLAKKQGGAVMAFRSKKKEQPVVKVEKEKILDVDASMQGTLAFKDPVNLRINGSFEGNLNTKGNLTIGQNAQVKADIIGENIVVSGKVSGNIVASGRLSLTRTASLQGEIRTSSLNISEGAIFVGKCQMDLKATNIGRATINELSMSVDDLAKYLEVDTDSVMDWVQKGRIPAQKQGSSWKFERAKVDAWIASEKIK